jgi:hypothetical protein
MPKLNARAECLAEMHGWDAGSAASLMQIKPLQGCMELLRIQRAFGLLG